MRPFFYCFFEIVMNETERAIIAIPRSCVTEKESPIIKIPARTEITVVKFEKTRAFPAGIWLREKFIKRKAQTEEITAR